VFSDRVNLNLPSPLNTVKFESIAPKSLRAPCPFVLVTDSQTDICNRRGMAVLCDVAWSGDCMESYVKGPAVCALAMGSIPGMDKNISFRHNVHTTLAASPVILDWYRR